MFQQRLQKHKILVKIRAPSSTSNWTDAVSEHGRTLKVNQQGCLRNKKIQQKAREITRQKTNKVRDEERTCLELGSAVNYTRHMKDKEVK